jgi:hypothetical protein
MSVEFPPPACTFIDDVVVTAIVLLLLLLVVFCALMTLKLAVVISRAIDNADMTATTVNLDFIVIGAGKLIV